MLVRSKSNIGPDNGGFAYHLEQVEAIPGVQASAVTWGEAIEGSARELLAEAETDRSDDGGEKSAQASAGEWLVDLLAEGPVSSKQIQADAKESGLSWATVRRAADALEVARQKDGLRGGWYWRLPEGAQKTSKMLTQKDEQLRDNLSTFVSKFEADDNPEEVL